MTGDNRPLKVLHVAETSQGGVGSYLEEIVTCQVERYGSSRVRVVLPGEHAALFQRLPPETLCPFTMAGAGRLICMLRMTRLAWGLVRRWQPDVVHLHSSYAGLLRPLLALMPGRPRVAYCAHGWAFDREGPRWLNWAIAKVEKACARSTDAVICISRHDQASALRAGMPPQRLVVVLNGVADVPDPPPQPQTPATARWPEGRLRILFVGRLDRQKGVDVLYEALRRLGDRAAAIVVGAPVVAEEAGASVVPSNARAIGWTTRDQINDLYRSAQVLVVPSRWEGFGLVALEAMRCGCAVVASRVGGLSEVVDNGVTGLLFEPGDAAGLAALLSTTSASKLAALGAAGRQRFERLFRIDRVDAELDALYRVMLARGPITACRSHAQGSTVADGS